MSDEKTGKPVIASTSCSAIRSSSISSSDSSSGDSEKKATIVGTSGISTLRRVIGESESRILLRQTERKLSTPTSLQKPRTPIGQVVSNVASGGCATNSGSGNSSPSQGVSQVNNDNEDARSATTTTSDVDSEDDAASIVSRLSQIIVEQEGKLHFGSDLFGDDSGSGSGDFSSGGLQCRSPSPKDQQIQQSPMRHRTAINQGGPKGTRYMTASTRRQHQNQQLRVPPPDVGNNLQAATVQAINKNEQKQQQQLDPKPKIEVVDCDDSPSSGIQKGADSDSISSQETTTGRSRAKSVIEAKTDSVFIRRNESSGHLPERGDLRTLEQSRKNLPGSRSTKLARSKSIRAGSEEKLTDETGQLMLNIRRSAWTLNEFDQTFNKSSEPRQLENDNLQLTADMSSTDPSSLYQANLIAGATAACAIGANLTMPPLAQPTSGCTGSIGNSSLLLPPGVAQSRRLSAAGNQINNVDKTTSMSGPNLLIKASKNAQQQTAVGLVNGPAYGNMLGDRLAVNKSPTAELEYERRQSAVSFASSLDSFWSSKHGLGGRDGRGRKRGDTYNNLDDEDGHNDGAGCPRRFTSCCRSLFNMHTIARYLPIVDWLPSYSLNFLWSDLVAGIVVAVLNISTSLSAAVVAETDLGAAFRASIVNTFVYALLCSSRHTSFGSWSIMSQMLLVSVRRALSDELLLNRLNIGPSRSWDAAEYEHWHLNIIIMYTFLIGLVQLMGGILKLGNILASFIPEALCSSMIAATAFTMAVGQLANMCGTTNKILWSIERNTTALWADLKHPPVDITDLFAGLFRWIQQIALLIKYHEQINLVCVLISVISVIALFLNQYVIQKQLERRFKKNILIPFEMILLIVMICISYTLDLSTNFSVATCSPVYIEFSIPTWPNLKLIRELWFESLATALISYTMVCIMAKTYGNKLNYEVDCNQELIACGAGNLIGGLFDALPATASLSRTAGQVEAGGQTQMASIINCIVLYAVAQLLGHHVAVLPVCVMSATLFYGFVRMLTRVTDVFKLWRVCKVDFTIWIVTFVAILTSDLVNGFVYGFIFSILTLLYRAQNRRCYMLGTIGSTDVYVPLVKYPVAQEIEGIKIFQFCGPINYVSADRFERLLRQKTRVNVKLLHRHIMEQGLKETGFRPRDLNLPTYIILDFSMISYIDSAGIHIIKKIIDDYLSINITILLASLASHVAKVIKSEPSLWEVHKDRFYITLADAVHCAIRENRSLQMQQQISTSSEEKSFEGC